MAKVKIEMTRAEYHQSLGDVPIVIKNLNCLKDSDSHARTGYVNRVARAVAGESELSAHTQVEVEIVIVG